MVEEKQQSIHTMVLEAEVLSCDYRSLKKQIVHSGKIDETTIRNF